MEENTPGPELVQDEVPEEQQRPTIILTFLNDGDVGIKTIGTVGTVLACGMLMTAIGWFSNAPIRKDLQALAQSLAHASMAPSDKEVH